MVYKALALDFGAVSIRIGLSLLVVTSLAPLN